MSDKPRLVIGEDDLVGAPEDGTAASAPQPTPAPQPPAGHPRLPVQPPPPRPVQPPPLSQPPLPPVSGAAPHQIGAPAQGYGPGTANPLNDPRVLGFVAAVIGIFLGWALGELSGILDTVPESNSDLNVMSGVWVGLVGMVFGAVYLSFDRFVAGALEDAAKRFGIALVPMFIVSFVSGFIAQEIYTRMIGEASFFTDPSEFKYYLARMIAWAIFGGAIGATIGFLDRSSQRAINGGLGGLAGGAIGGAIFHYITTNMDFGVGFSRLIGLTTVALLVALGIRLIETARREAWLKIVSGGMSGKEFIVYHAVTRIGASPDCEIFLLKDPAVQPLHAQIVDQDGRRTITATGPVLINQVPVGQQLLRAGDQIQIGSTVISYSERALPGPVNAIR